MAKRKKTKKAKEGRDRYHRKIPFNNHQLPEYEDIHFEIDGAMIDRYQVTPKAAKFDET